MYFNANLLAMHPCYTYFHIKLFPQEIKKSGGGVYVGDTNLLELALKKIKTN